MEKLRQRHEIRLFLDWQALLVIAFMIVLTSWYVQFRPIEENTPAEKLAHFCELAQEHDTLRRRVKPRDWSDAV